MPALTIYTTDGGPRQLDFTDLAVALKLRDDLENTTATWTRFTADDGVEITYYHRHITQIVLDPTYKPPAENNPIAASLLRRR